MEVLEMDRHACLNAYQMLHLYKKTEKGAQFARTLRNVMHVFREKVPENKALLLPFEEVTCAACQKVKVPKLSEAQKTAEKEFEEKCKEKVSIELDAAGYLLFKKITDDFEYEARAAEVMAKIFDSIEEVEKKNKKEGEK